MGIIANLGLCWFCLGSLVGTQSWGNVVASDCLVLSQQDPGGLAASGHSVAVPAPLGSSLWALLAPPGSSWLFLAPPRPS